MSPATIGVAVMIAIASVGLATLAARLAARLDARGFKRAGGLVSPTLVSLMGLAIVLATGASSGWTAGQLAVAASCIPLGAAVAALLIRWRRRG